MRDRIVMAKRVAIGIFVIVWAGLMLAAWVGESRRWTHDEGVTMARTEGVIPTPVWMPASWQPSFRETFSLGRVGSVLGADLEDLRLELPRLSGAPGMNPWVEAKSVRVRRDFHGRLFVDLRINKPVCVLRYGARVRYASIDGIEMDLALPSGVDPRVILDRGAQRPLCLVQMDGIRDTDAEQRHRWVRDIVRFVAAWDGDARIASRLRLDQVMPQVYPQGEKKVCKLTCQAEDIKAKKTLSVEWGINSEEKNASEDKANREKRDELARIVTSTSGPIANQDLRYGIDFF